MRWRNIHMPWKLGLEADERAGRAVLLPRPEVSRMLLFNLDHDSNEAGGVAGGWLGHRAEFRHLRPTVGMVQIALTPLIFSNVTIASGNKALRSEGAVGLLSRFRCTGRRKAERRHVCCLTAVGPASLREIAFTVANRNWPLWHWPSV